MRRLRHGHRRHRRAALNERELVRRGYDAIAPQYEEWRVQGNPAVSLVRELDRRLPDHAGVVELGCGNGTPAAVILAARHRYTGIDISGEQLARARALLPDARFVQADYTTVEIEAGSQDAVVAILTLTHVPREEHAGLFLRIATWLRPGGFFLASLGARDNPGAVDDNWLGAPMYFSHFDAETNRRLVTGAGFELLRDELVTMVEEGYGDATFLWLLARRR